MKFLNMCRFRWMIALFLPLCLAQTCQPINADPNLFGIYVSTLDGRNMKPIITDSYREMNHAHVSPDKKWVTFTRFNNVKRGLAEEKGGYNKTEIMIVRLDGTGLQSLTPPRRGIAAVNSYWTPNGKSILYLSTDNPKKHGQINQMEVATRKISRIRTPEDIFPGDPHQIGSKIVFPAIKNPKADIRATWIMDLATGQARQITRPSFPESAKKLKPYPGDSDTKFSPDGTKVALMRHMGKDNWHIVIVDVKTSQERDISKGVTCDAMPEWSSDGKLLIFWHVDKKKLRNTGLYTIRPDGTERKKIPLPPGYLYTMPAFFLGEGSGPDARIIFSAKKMPGI